jgi:hypothetical protein
MNSSLSNSSTASPQNDGGGLPPLNVILDIFGDTLILNYMWLIPYVVFGSLGFLGNILCLVVLLNKEFAGTPIYLYLRIYSVNSGLLCLLSIFIFVCGTKHIFPWLNSYGSQVYFLWVYLPGAYAMQALAPLLDIVVTIDRIAIFNKSVKAIMARASPRIVCAVCIAISVLNGLFYYAQSVPQGIPVGSVLDTSTGQVITDLVIWVPGNTQFADSEAGKLFFTVYFFVRESILMLGEIVSNCVSMFYLKGYYSKKMAQVIKENSPSNRANKKKTTNVVSTTPLVNTAETVVAVVPTTEQVVERVAAQQVARLSQADRNATVMALVLCLLSIITHTVTIGSNLYGTLQPTAVAGDTLKIQIYAFVTSKLFLIGSIGNPNKKPGNSDKK